MFTRYDKLDVMFIGVITFALIIDGLRLCKQALAIPPVTQDRMLSLN